MMRPGKKRRPVKTLERSGAAESKSVTDLLAIMARLRGPSGCPWDREQTGQSLKKFLIEEAYETLEAIENGTAEALKEELGDLLLQIVFLSRIAEERREFSFWDVVHTLAEKLIRRHPHIFPPTGGSPVVAENAQDVVKLWRTVKESEGKYKGERSLIDDIPLALPALERAQSMARRVSKIAGNRLTIDAVWKDIQEKFAELKRATGRSSSRVVEKQLGNLIFTLVNWARLNDLSAEEALRKSNRRFSNRVRQVESRLRRQGRRLEKSTPEEVDRIWNTVQIIEKRRH